MKLKFEMNSVIKLTAQTFCNGRFFGPVSYVSHIADLYLNTTILRNQFWETEYIFKNCRRIEEQNPNVQGGKEVFKCLPNLKHLGTGARFQKHTG
jgi:hypothetical protein